MPYRKNPSLTEILNAFKNTMEKKAEGEMQICPVCGDPACDGSCMLQQASGAVPGAAPEGAPAPDEAPAPAPEAPAPAPEEGVTPEALAQAAQALTDATDNAEAADAQVVDAKETLQDMADEFINEHDAALSKEAQVYGKLFAASCIEEMNKQAALNEATANAYGQTMEYLPTLQKCAAEAYDVTMEQLNSAANMNVASQLYSDAYCETMAKLAGFEDMDELNEAAGHELSPEEVAAVYDASQADSDSDPIEDLSDEELQDLAERISDEAESRAAEDDATSPEAVAQAADLLSAARDDDGDYDEEKVASEFSQNAYQAAMAAIAGR